MPPIITKRPFLTSAVGEPKQKNQHYQESTVAFYCIFLTVIQNKNLLASPAF